MVLERDEVRGVIVIPILVLKLKVREETISFLLRSSSGNLRLEAADNGKRVAPGAPEVHDGRNKQVDLLAGSKDRAEIEAGGENTDDGDRAVDGSGAGVDRDGLSDDIWI